MTGGRGLDSGGFLTRRRSGKERRPLLGEHHLAVDAVSAGKRGFKGGAWRHCGRLQESYRVDPFLKFHILTFSVKMFHPMARTGELVEAAQVEAVVAVDVGKVEARPVPVAGLPARLAHALVTEGHPAQTLDSLF